MDDRLLTLLARIRSGMTTRADADTLSEIVNDYERRIDAMYQALYQVEWIEIDGPASGMICPWCGKEATSRAEYSHAPDCARQTALGIFPKKPTDETPPTKA